jgi:hypothetical protein
MEAVSNPGNSTRAVTSSAKQHPSASVNDIETTETGTRGFKTRSNAFS